MDFNADGYMDIVTGTFDGSAWVSYGSAKGFKQPDHILDKNGRRIMLSYFNDWKDKKFPEYKSEDHTGGVDLKAHCISTVAFDWDADGDYDLLLGDRKGHLWLQMNEGNAKKPAFAGLSKQIELGGKPFDVKGKMTNIKLVDWDKDGLTDFVVGTFGDIFNYEKGGEVKWYRNIGKKGKPRFEEAKVLIEKSSMTSKKSVAPDLGLYVDVVDYNKDGLLDLLVGGESGYKGMDREGIPHVWIYLQKKSDKK